jgi:hypothetical protein
MPPIGIAIMGAAAVTPNLSSYFFFSSDNSRTVMLPIKSSTWSIAVDISGFSFWVLWRWARDSVTPSITGRAGRAPVGFGR